MKPIFRLIGAVLTTIGIYLMFEGHRAAGCGCMSAGLVCLHAEL